MENRTKRNNNFRTRKDKKTTGYSKVCKDQDSKFFNKKVDRQSKKHTSEMNALAVHGTFDKLGSGRWLLVRTVTIEHPVYKGYFKKVKRLSDNGRKKLARMKK